jgi:hypothetical protein
VVSCVKVRKRPSRSSFFFNCSKASCRAPISLRLHQFDHQLVFPSGLVNADAPIAQNLKTIFRDEAKATELSAKEDRLDLALVVFQGEVGMA